MEKWIAKRKIRFVELGIGFYVTNDCRDEHDNRLHIDESSTIDELEKRRKDYEEDEYEWGRAYSNKLLSFGSASILLHGVRNVLPGGFIEGSKSDRSKLFDQLHDYMTVVCGWPKRL